MRYIDMNIVRRALFIAFYVLSFVNAVDISALHAGDEGFRRILVARHGQRPSGGDPALTKLGVKQAKLLARYVSSLDFNGSIYASPYLRTVETAAQTAKLLDLKIKLEADFQERTHIHGKANIEGRSQKDLEKIFPGLISQDPALQQSWIYSDNYGNILTRRAVGALERILKNTKGDIFIVTHKAVVLALMDWMLSKDGMKFKGFEVWNCELVYFIVDSKGAFRFVSAGIGFIPPPEISNNFKQPLILRAFKPF